ncbi:MAG: MBL fold metallo-hydrolase [Deltaproteobacteria bacterium]|nr:MBL fold metallo-hydrolase [Deltaproteobacteria bacterium]
MTKIQITETSPPPSIPPGSGTGSGGWGVGESRISDDGPPFLITLPQPYPGLERFIGSWVIPGPPTIVVDTGPASSVDRLAAEIKDRGLNRIDYIFISHIHIDHAGGLGLFLRHFPTARAVVHASGLKHLVNPAKLWAGSLKTLQDMAAAYGPIEPVPADRLSAHTDFALPGLQILETPGHAPHHLAFDYEGQLFAGEAAGVYLPYWDRLYLRPPTPPRFFFEQAVTSVDRLRTLPDRPIYFAHLGFYPHSREILGAYRDQLYYWLDTADRALKENPADPVAQTAERLLAEDPRLKDFQSLDEAEQGRERYFTRNSLAGFVGYLRERSNV